MTLAEIRSEIARVVDNGVPAVDSRVIQRVNQAQRRLHAVRAWVGAVAKYKVDVSNNVFSLPTQLESIFRVTKNNAQNLPAGPVLLCDNAYAFVHDDGELVPLQFEPIGSTANDVKFRVDPTVSPTPTQVVIAGKKKMIDVVNDTDELVIGDLEALKLMVMALWREENNQLELAAGLINRAVEHLTMKTDSAVEAARRLVYQTRLSVASIGTMGFVRAKLGLDLEFGLKLDDAKMFDLVNKAQDLLVSKKRLLLSSARYGVKDGLTLPTYTYITSDSATLPVEDFQTVKLAVLSLMANSLSPANSQVNPEIAAKYEAEAAKSLEEDLIVELEQKRHAQYNTNLQSFAVGTFGHTKARMALELPNGLRMSDSEIARIVNRAEETLVTKGRWAGTVEEIKVTIPKDGMFYLPANVDSIISAALNDSPVPVFEQTYDFNINGPGYETTEDNSGAPAIIARGERFVNNLRTRVYFVRGNWNDTVCARLMIKRRHLDHTLNSEIMLIRNYPALFEMALSLGAQTTDLERSKFHEEQAMSLLRADLEQYQSAHRQNINIQSPGFAMGEIGAMV